MRVLHVINNLAAGGAEKLVVDLVNSQQAAGVQADLLLLNDRNSVYSRQDLIGQAKLLFSSRKLSAYNPWHWFRVAHFIRDYEIVHVHLFPSQYWAILGSVLVGGRIPVVTTEHSTFNGRMSRPRLKRLERQIFSRFAKIVAISTETQDALQAWTDLTDDHFVVIPNGVDLTLFRRATPVDRRELFGAEVSADDRLLAMVGRFEHPKDHLTVLRALALLPSRYTLILVGNGSRRAEYVSYCHDHGLDGRVVFAGFRRDVASVLRACDFAVLSSAWEGVPLAAIESMSAGLPVLASDVVGLRGLVGGAGTLFKAADDEDLARQVERLECQSAHERHALLARQEERARRYDLTSATQSYIELYESVVALSGTQ